MYPPRAPMEAELRDPKEDGFNNFLICALVLLGIAAVEFLGAHQPKRAIWNAEMAVSWLLTAVLIKSGVEKKRGILILIAFLVVAAGLD